MKIMNSLTTIVAVAGLMLAGTGNSHGHSKANMGSDHSMANIKSASVDIELPSVQCGMCENRIETGLSGVDGIKSVDVDIDGKVGHVTYNPRRIDIGGIEQSIAGLCYWANNTPADRNAYENLSGCCQMSDSEYKQMMKASMKVSGNQKHAMKMDHSKMNMRMSGRMTDSKAQAETKMAMIDLPTVQCGMCQSRIEGDLSKVNGIITVNVDTDRQMGHVIYDPAAISLREIENAISEIGYQANDTPANREAYSKLPGCCRID